MRTKGRRRHAAVLVQPNRPLQTQAAKLIWQRGENPFRNDETRLLCFAPKWYPMPDPLEHTNKFLSTLLFSLRLIRVELHTRGVYLCSSDDDVLVRSDPSGFQPEMELIRSFDSSVVGSAAFSNRLQGPAKKRFPGCENLVLAVAYHFCLALPEKFSQPGNHSFAGPCRVVGLLCMVTDICIDK